MALLVLNAGSSNLKASIFNFKNGKLIEKEPVWTKKVNWQKSNLDDCRVQLESLLQSLPQEISLVAHRIVHGGDKHFKPVSIDEEVVADLKAISELAPLHQPVSLIAIECVSGVLGMVKQMAVFDTAFHQSMAESARVYPLPYEWYEKHGIHRFGFHGLSYAYATRRISEIEHIAIDSVNAVICHLGSGASLCAVRAGKSVFTTMGFTPLDGIMMGTRCGSIDPGIILHLQKSENISLAQIEESLNENSGLKGICAHSDLHEVEELIAKGDKRAELAFEIYINKLASSISGLFTYFDNLPLLVFTGGAGENSILLRKAVAQRLAFAGIELDHKLNQTAKLDCTISSKQSSAKLLVVQSKEDLAIAEECVGFTAST